jgi:hypothetical protein
VTPGQAIKVEINKKRGGLMIMPDQVRH